MARNILLIDDDADDRELFREAISVVDPNVTYQAAEDGEDALRKLVEPVVSLPDVIFLDINLPGMSGWQCLKELKLKEPLRRIPVIMYSTSNHQRDKEIAKDLGAVCLITKPANYRVLVEILTTVVNYTRTGNVHKIEEELCNSN